MSACLCAMKLSGALGGFVVVRHDDGLGVLWVWMISGYESGLMRMDEQEMARPLYVLCKGDDVIEFAVTGLGNDESKWGNHALAERGVDDVIRR